VNFFREEEVVITKSEASKKIRAALRSAFPSTKFTVSLSSGHLVMWTDDGPSVTEVEDALLAAGCAKAKTAWNDTRYIEVAGDTLYFDRFNAAERAAYQQDLEHRKQEYAAQQQREVEAVKQAQQAKRAAAEPLRRQNSPPVQDPAVFEAFEKLRQRAETEAPIHADAERRPSWAPPLILGEELAEGCLELEYLTLDDKWIGRLWATFATPKRSGHWLREHVSSLPLQGISCRGFELYAGGTRGTRGGLLFEAQREESGAWRFGPHEWPAEYWSPRQREWEGLIRDRERARSICSHPSQAQDLELRLANLTRKIEAIDAEDAVKAKAHRDRQQLRQRVLELARARVLDFIGAPDAQMQAAGRLCGHCCNCWRELTDLVSLERGIGPECLKHKVNSSARWPSPVAGLRSSWS
jgi:hypothetical protein